LVAFQRNFGYSDFDHLEDLNRMNSTLLAIVFIVMVASAAALAVVQLRRRASAPSGGAWDGEFDIDRYRPMERLLAADEASYLSTAGLSHSELKQFRKQRRRLFERYLRNLEADFARLHSAARTLVLDAPEDRPELAAAIIRQQIAFKRTVWTVRLGLRVPGFSGAAAQVGRLLELADGMGSSARLVRAGSTAVS
jgi:hypothetical protein